MSNRTDIKIFIASSGELNEERKDSVIVITELNKRYPHLHLEPVLFEIDTPSGNFPWKKRVQDGINPLLKEAHIVIVLFYSKAGEFTREEFQLALDQEKKVYLYLKEGFAPKSLAEGKKYLEVLELKDNVEKESALRYQPYKTLTDYYGLMYRDLEKYIDEFYPASVSAPPPTMSTSSQRIPAAPRPYLAHPYSIIKNFTGRREEMTRLTEWYKYEKEPMCVVEAIGGMGKSALCWKWLQDEIIAAKPATEGIVWWSFYDQGFEDFIHHMYEYCIPEEIRNKQQRLDEATEVINALASRHFLLVLDGFERVLRGYAQMMAMYIQEEGLSRRGLEDMKAAFDIQQRTPITPKAEKLLRVLCAGNSKALMTTRLFPATIEGLAGVKHIRLTGLSKTDTITFFKTEGITGGDEEMIRAGEVYGFHPLMLKLLSTAIKRSRLTWRIDQALQEAFSMGLIDENEPQKILATSYKLLNEDERKVASTISVFRTAFTFDAAKALFVDMESAQLERILIELCNLGFVLYNAQQCLFDFHPILRSYLYNGLTGKNMIHELAITYFTALPPKEKIITLTDLDPVIERYHHLVRAGKYNEAYRLYVDKLHDPLFYQLAQYNLCIGLCNQLFAHPADQLPQLNDNRRQSYILSVLALCYDYIGELNKANKFLTSSVDIDHKAKDDSYLGAGLKNISDLVHLPSGKLLAAMVSLQKSVALLKSSDPFREADIHRMFGYILTARASYTAADGQVTAATYFHQAITFCIGAKERGLASRISLEYTRWAIAQTLNKLHTAHALQQEAFDWGLKAMNYADQFRISINPNLLYSLAAYEAVSRALIAAAICKGPMEVEAGGVLFYDEHFQHIIDTVVPKPDNYLALGERCVHEGLTLSRKTNRVFEECMFMLLLAQVEWLKIKDRQRGSDHFAEVERLVTDTHTQAAGTGYRMLLADLHLFCAEALLDMQEWQPAHQEKLLKLSSRDHISKAREYAREISTLKDIFLPPDADMFYKDIPEYEMLKRGPTEEERIENGYYAAWLRAAQLEKRL